MLGHEKELVALDFEDVEADVSQQLAQCASREQLEVALSVRRMLTEKPEPVSVFLSRTRLGEDGLDTEEQQKAIEPTGEIWCRQDESSSGPEYSSRLLKACIGVEDVLDHFSHDDKIDRGVISRQSVGHVLDEDLKAVFAQFAHGHLRQFDTDTANGWELTTKRAQKKTATTAQVKHASWRCAKTGRDEAGHPVVKLRDVSSVPGVKGPRSVMTRRHSFARLHGNDVATSRGLERWDPTP